MGITTKQIEKIITKHGSLEIKKWDSSPSFPDGLWMAGVNHRWGEPQMYCSDPTLDGLLTKLKNDEFKT